MRRCFSFPRPTARIPCSGFHIPGLGIILTGAVVLLTGMLAANFIGRWLFALWDSILSRIPLVRSIYGSARKFSEVLFADRDQTFSKVLLVEYPRKGRFPPRRSRPRSFRSSRATSAAK